LRLEAALNLYGQEMDAGTSPLTSGLAWTVALEPADRKFRGRGALEQQQAAGITEKLTGLLLEDRGIMRHGQRVLTRAGEGVITSGGFSPTMERSIALARVPAAAEGPCQVEIRGALKAARIVRPPFVRHGRILVQ
jgi:aminomethyltransferase